LGKAEAQGAPKYPYFEEETSVEVVNARMGPDVDPRLREVMTVLVKHLHAAIKEIEPTHEEWLQGIGHRHGSDQRRIWPGDLVANARSRCQGDPRRR
jgi:hypothetical protein